LGLCSQCSGIWHMPFIAQPGPKKCEKIKTNVEKIG
jgi:hypothetical protein